MEEVYNFLKECDTYYLATMDGEQPRVRPFGTVNIFEGKLYFQTGKVKNVSKQMQINPKIEICAYNGEKWVRIEAKAIRDDRFEPKEALLENYPYLKRMYSASDDNTEVLYLKDATATFSSFTAEPKMIKF